MADGESTLEALRREAVRRLDRGERLRALGSRSPTPRSPENWPSCSPEQRRPIGRGRDLLLAWPEIGDALAPRFSGLSDLARALYGAGIATLDPRAQLTGGVLVCQVHAEFSRTVLGLTPSAAVGLSSGETNALLAFGVWRDLEAMLDEMEASGFYGEQLTGSCRVAASEWGLGDHEPSPWECWRAHCAPIVVEEALAAEPRAYMTIVQAPDDCVIGGDPAACRRVIDAIDGARAMPLGLDMVVHCRAMTPFADAWRRIHTRETYGVPVPGVRFYTNAGNRAYTPTRDAAAEAITQQALEPIYFPATVLRAWEDGVRVFVEHGPRGILTGAIPKILGDRPHVAVALDAQERRGIRALAETVAKLWVHGLPVRIEAFDARMQQLREQVVPLSSDNARKLTLAAHRPDIVSTPEASGNAPVPMPGLDAGSFQHMPPAPPYPAPLVLTQHVLTESETGPGVISHKAVAAVSDKTAAALNLVASVSEAHAVFVERQAQAHASFLKARGALFAAATGRQRQLPADPPSAPAAVTPVTQRSRPLPPADPPSTAAPVTPVTQPPLYTRAQLETLAGGNISEVFGPLFAELDQYPRLVRMPQPPLLLADRVMSIDGEPGSMGTGRIVTETDVSPDAWYMHAGRMSPGVVIESGAADLLLASWLGADFTNRSERVYRLLGCDLKFMGELPRGGETLRYDIHIDGHAKTGATRLFFFHYDCYIDDRLMISVRNGQAGFFSDEELSQSDGVLWDAAAATARDGAHGETSRPVERKSVRSTAGTSTRFAEGRASRASGAALTMAAPHVRTPAIPGGEAAADRRGRRDSIPRWAVGPGLPSRHGGRAAELVLRRALQERSVHAGHVDGQSGYRRHVLHLAAYGFTIDRDGWRFEPVPDETARFVCRGQVTPDSAHILDYEVFVEEIIDGPTPTVFAALLCRSDGFKVFHCRRFGLRLVPDWPVPSEVPGPARTVGNSRDVRGDRGALLASARGRLSDAFGVLYAPFDGARRAPRFPGEPYHFVSRIVSVDGAPGTPVKGGAAVTEYDVPADAWYFADANSAAVPLSALIEILLQPCGWLGSYMGFAANRADDVIFRNLDGAEVVLHKKAGVGVLRVTSRLERFVESGWSTIVFFDVVCTQGDDLVMSMKPAFGFFSPAALETQVGLPAGAEVVAGLSAAAPVSLPYQADGLSGAPWLGRGKLQLIDRVHFWPGGGAGGLGRLVAEADVDPEAWFFKAHFFQDPVQPGSLGLEAIQQAARAAARLSGLADGDGFEFEPVAVGQPFSWKLRGQVLPTNTRTRTEVEILSTTRDDRGVLILFEGAFWVDDLRIYETRGMGVRVVERSCGPNRPATIAR